LVNSEYWLGVDYSDKLATMAATEQKSPVFRL